MFRQWGKMAAFFLRPPPQQMSVSQVCTNLNRCYCYSGWAGPDCSMSVPTTTLATTTSEETITQSHNMEKIEKTYGNYQLPFFLNIFCPQFKIFEFFHWKNWLFLKKQKYMAMVNEQHKKNLEEFFFSLIKSLFSRQKRQIQHLINGYNFSCYR